MKYLIILFVLGSISTADDQTAKENEYMTKRTRLIEEFRSVLNDQHRSDADRAEEAKLELELLDLDTPALQRFVEMRQLARNTLKNSK